MALDDEIHGILTKKENYLNYIKDLQGTLPNRSWFFNILSFSYWFIGIYLRMG